MALMPKTEQAGMCLVLNAHLYCEPCYAAFPYLEQTFDLKYCIPIFKFLFFNTSFDHYQCLFHSFALLHSSNVTLLQWVLEVCSQLLFTFTTWCTWLKSACIILISILEHLLSVDSLSYSTTLTLETSDMKGISSAALVSSSAVFLQPSHLSCYHALLTLFLSQYQR
jgi:hypothetical protein